jgi:hypothetical protein
LVYLRRIGFHGGCGVVDRGQKRVAVLLGGKPFLDFGNVEGLDRIRVGQSCSGLHIGGVATLGSRGVGRRYYCSHDRAWPVCDAFGTLVYHCGERARFRVGVDVGEEEL